MGKPLMISEDVYNRLKKLKEERNESFSKTIGHLLEDKSSPNKAWEVLDKLAGTFKDDKEFDEIMKDSKKMWKRWGKKSA